MRSATQKGVIGLLAVLFLAGAAPGIWAAPPVSQCEVCSKKCQYTGIQEAIDDQLVTGTCTEITVREGTYQDNIDFKGLAIPVQSSDPSDPAVVAGTIIEGKDPGSVVRFTSGEQSATVLTGFTIRNGYGTDSGGGIYIAHSSPTITNCVISGNSANSKGGGIMILGDSVNNDAAPLIENCTIDDNTATNLGGGISMAFSRAVIRNCQITNNRMAYQSNMGGGIEIWGGEPTIEGSTISGNTSPGYYGSGAGIAMRADSLAHIKGCQILGNGVDGIFYYGGGISIDESSPVIEDTVISDNVASFGAGIFIKNSDPGVPSAPTIENCVISGNEASDGGGIWVGDESTPAITNCTIVNNTHFSSGGGIYCNEAGSNPTVTNTIVYFNGTEDMNVTACDTPVITYSNVGSCATIPECDADVTNIDAPPVFDTVSCVSNYALAEGSPGINGGAVVTAYDICGLNRDDGAPDMGAYEFAGGSCNNDCVCDPGESCTSCPNDCLGRQCGDGAAQFCCGDGIAQGAEGNGLLCNGNF